MLSFRVQLTLSTSKPQGATTDPTISDRESLLLLDEAIGEYERSLLYDQSAVLYEQCKFEPRVMSETARAVFIAQPLSYGKPIKLELLSE